jgi:hypothetical protein
LAKSQYNLPEFVSKTKKEILLPLTYGFLYNYKDAHSSLEFDRLKLIAQQTSALNAPNRVLSMLEESLRLSEANPKMHLVLTSSLISENFLLREFDLTIDSMKGHLEEARTVGISFFSSTLLVFAS